MSNVAYKSNSSLSDTSAPGQTSFSLRWKLFLSLVLILGMVLTIIGRWGWINLMSWHDRYTNQQFALNAITINALIDQTAGNLSTLTTQLLATIDVPAAEEVASDSFSELNLSAELLSSLSWIELYNTETDLIASWGASGEDDESRKKLLLELATRAAVSLIPAHVLYCADQCELLVIVPAFDKREQAFIVMTAMPFHNLIQGFYDATGVDVAYLTADATGQERLLAVSNAKWVHPLVQQAIEQGALPAGSVAKRFNRTNRSYSLYEVKLSELARIGHEFHLILVRDDTLAIRRIRLSSNAYIAALGFGMLFASAAIFLLLSRALRRLDRVTKALPALAEQDFASARRLLQQGFGLSAHPDEVDALRDSLDWANSRLEQLYGAEAASEAKSRFLATMSHEIRTPLSGILGLIEILETSPMNSDQKRTTHMIHDSAKSLMSIISDVLDYSRVEAGSATVENVPFSLREITEEAAATIAGGALRKGIRLVVTVDPRLPESVQGDPGKTRQILLNLASNALKFTDAGRVLLRAELKNHDSDAVWVRFTISDTGIGIPEQAKGRLFQRFSQADASTTRRFGGSGLGLAICKSLTELLGGNIGFESIEAVGSRFWFELPCKTVETSSEIELASLTGLKVRIIGDDKDDVLGWRDYCELAGAQVIDSPPPPSQNCDYLEVLAIHNQQFSGAKVMSLDQKRNVRASLSLARPVRLRELIDAVFHVHQAAIQGRDADSPGITPAANAGIQFQARVLVAEDHPINLELLSKQLRHLGCEVIESENGEEALQQLESQPLDLVISDLHMPGIDGYTLARRIRDHRDATIRKLPFIILTASAGPADEEKLRRHRVSEKLVKPATLQQLADCLSRYLVPQNGAATTAKQCESEHGGAEQAAQDEQAAQTASPIDPSIIHEVIGDDSNLLKKIATDFIHTNDRLQQQLLDALQAQKSDDIKSLAHRFKGSAKSLGAHALVECLQALESAPDSPQLDTMSTRLMEAYSQLRRYLIDEVTGPVD